MRKIIWTCAGVIVCSVVLWAASTDMKMVTYFPTRYMIYQDVTVKGPMEVGIGQAAKLDVAKDVTMTHGRVADSTTLTLTGADINSSSKYGQSITSGSGSTDTRGTLQFDGGVTVPATGLSSGVQSIETDHKATLTNLKLGNKDFPGCSADGNQISWQKLTIGGTSGTEGVFLVCGTGTTPTCDSNPPACQVLKNGTCQEKQCSGGKVLRKSDCKCVCNDTEASCKLPSNMGYYGYLDSNGCCACEVGLAYYSKSYTVGSWCANEPLTVDLDTYDMPSLSGTVTQLSFNTNTCRWEGLCSIPNYVWKSLPPSSPYYGQEDEHCYPLGATKAGGYTCRQDAQIPNVTLSRFKLGSHDYTSVHDSSWLDY